MKIKAFGICLYKKENNKTKILLCKSVSSRDKWGLLKGVQEKNETDKQTAIREFQEECGINVSSKYLQKYFFQENKEKDIGIYLANYDDLHGVERYFVEDKLLSNYLSWENSQVKFFDIKKLPMIKKKQKHMMEDIVSYLTKE